VQNQGGGKVGYSCKKTPEGHIGAISRGIEKSCETDDKNEQLSGVLKNYARGVKKNVMHQPWKILVKPKREGGGRTGGKRRQRRGGILITPHKRNFQTKRGKKCKKKIGSGGSKVAIRSEYATLSGAGWGKHLQPWVTVLLIKGAITNPQVTRKKIGPESFPKKKPHEKSVKINKTSVILIRAESMTKGL